MNNKPRITLQLNIQDPAVKNNPHVERWLKTVENKINEDPNNQLILAMLMGFSKTSKEKIDGFTL